MRGAGNLGLGLMPVDDPKSRPGTVSRISSFC
jgi:hypothetical protein